MSALFRSEIQLRTVQKRKLDVLQHLSVHMLSLTFSDKLLKWTLMPQAHWVVQIPDEIPSAPLECEGAEWRCLQVADPGFTPRPFKEQTGSPYPAQWLKVLARLGGWLKRLIANIHFLCGPRINGADSSRAGCQAQQLNQPPWAKPVSPRMCLSHKCVLLGQLNCFLFFTPSNLTFACYSHIALTLLENRKSMVYNESSNYSLPWKILLFNSSGI